MGQLVSERELKKKRFQLTIYLLLYTSGPTLTDGPHDRLTDWLNERKNHYQKEIWEKDPLVDWLTDSQADWQTDWLIYA